MFFHPNWGSQACANRVLKPHALYPMLAEDAEVPLCEAKHADKNPRQQ